MKIFGTAQPFIESPESSFKLGRLVANYSFYKALFKYSDFDQFHIFCPTFANCRLTEEKISQEDIPPANKAKIKVFHISALKKSIAQTDYHVFHLGGWGFFFPGLIYLRNLHSPKPFPITAMIHSLNAKQASFHALKVCSAPTMPFDSVVCSSNCGKEALSKLFEATKNNFSSLNPAYSGRMDVIPLGIDDIHRTIPGHLESRRSLGIGSDSFVILSLGRLTANKKMDYAPFLTAIRRFVEKNRDKKIELILAGGADEQQHTFMQDLINENQLQGITKLFINFEDSKKSLLYSAADVYAAPIDNLQETFGISVVEAMAHECAVVVSDFNGYSEIVDDGINGIKIPTFWADALEQFEDVSEIMNAPTYQILLSQSIAVDIDKMTQAFQQLLDDRQQCKTLGKAAREKVKSKYFWADIIKRYCILWEQLADEAANCSLGPEKIKNPWEVDYWSVFSHYPSNIISPTAELSLSEFGRESLISGNIPPSYSEISASVILPGLVTTALGIIGQGHVTVEKMAAQLQTHAEISDSTALYYLLWLTKYNLVNISQ